MAVINKTELRRLQKKGVSDPKIAEIFGVTRQAIHQLRKKFDIPSRYEKNDDRNEQIYKLYESGTPAAKLAKKFKLSVSQTFRIISKATGGSKKKATRKKAASKKKARKK
ncbi:MAG: helix-turn-helix domain-containing protein [Chitinivibrionales bacterium]|nr:helix-turn-helix domain-containing protein [Chitinivibrionales bacterium]